ncbi:MAG: M28 family peptidase [Anaerolineales bacterium]
MIVSCSSLKNVSVVTPTIEPLKQIENDLTAQLSCGARTPQSPCHTEVQQYIIAQLKQNHWQVENQNFTYNGHPGVNIIGRFGIGNSPIIIGAHYDTRLFADQDPNPAKRSSPVPGANDGASGVAVLLDLARKIPLTLSPQKTAIWLVFFDLEDDGNFQSWDWILGSTAFVEQLSIQPKAAVIVDMVGDKDLHIYYEYNSNGALRQQIWAVAQRLGYENVFIPQIKYNMLDDHTPFLMQGIPAVDIIDFDYPFWHTTEDTLDKISPQSIQIVSQTLLEWLK